MIHNPPFPYACRIVHFSEVNSFTGEAVESILYDGECDVEGNKYPTLKEGVLVNKVKIYINDLTNARRVYNHGDRIFVNRLGKEEEYILNDYWPTNFGTTIQCDMANN